MEFTWGGRIYQLMVVQRPAGTHLSQSSTLGVKSPLLRDAANKLVGHAGLSGEYKAPLVILAMGAVAGAVTGAVAWPYAKSGLISLKSKLSRQADETPEVEAPAPTPVAAEVEPEQPDAPRLCVVGPSGQALAAP